METASIALSPHGSSPSAFVDSKLRVWVDDMGKSPDKQPLVLDSTGDSGIDANGSQIPDGIYLRAFRPTGFYFEQASHAIRVIPDDAN